MAIDMLMGQPIIEDAMGIVAAHLYYFLAVLYPRHAPARHAVCFGRQAASRFASLFA